MASATIGTAASRAGVHVETIRFYERKHLIEQPPKPRGGYRYYPDDTISRIRFIKHAQSLGFSLREIATLLDLKDNPRSDAGKVYQWASTKLEDIEARIAGLEIMRQELAALVAACPGQGQLCRCGILRELENPVNPESERTPSTRGRSTMKTITLEVTGMHCGGCEQVIQHVLESEPGVTACTASHTQRQARIAYDPQRLSPQRLVEVIQAAGYGTSIPERSE